MDRRVGCAGPGSELREAQLEFGIAEKQREDFALLLRTEYRQE